jgi:broad specificity phosphatase PhoE
MKLYLLRHGESVDDIEDCYGGVADFPLTDAGREKARSVAESLRRANLQMIFTSPLVRASETADIIAKELANNIPVKEVEDLQERNSYGVLSGVNKERAAQIFKRVLSGLKEKPGYSREFLLGAEDFDAFILRVQKGFAEVIDLAKENNVETFAIVTHGKFTQALFEYVLKIREGVDLNLSAINIIDYQPATATIGQLAAVSQESVS